MEGSEKEKKEVRRYSTSLSRREEMAKKIYESSQTETFPERIDFVWKELETIESIPLRTKVTVECVLYSYDMLQRTPPQNEAYIRNHILKKMESSSNTFFWFC